MMKSSEFVAKLKDVATNYKTLYVNGCFGSPMNAANKRRYCDNTDYNRQASRTAKINAASADTFGFDCVCLIKGILWGWTGDKSKTYGGATYKTNGVPDINADAMIKECTDLSTDFSKIEIGEAVWMQGHIGVYIGDGLAVECTPVWKDGVQITACNRSKSGYNRRDWKKHGKLPYIEYVEAVPKPEKQPESTAKVKAGDLVSISTHATYYNGKTVPDWVKRYNWYVDSVGGDRAVIGRSEDGNHNINSPIHVRHLTVCKGSTAKPVDSAADFFPERGYFKLGDTSPNVGKVAEFMLKMFPLYTTEQALGNYYGPNLAGSITEFQRRRNLEPDGCLGPITLAELKKFGFSY